MRSFSVMSAALLILCGMTATSRADNLASASAVAATAQPAVCDEPGPRPQRVKKATVKKRYVKRRRPVMMASHVIVPVHAAYYDAPIPSPYDSAYDRGMTLHFRSPPVSGIYVEEPGFPPTPPIAPIQPYRKLAAGAVVQYDGLTGEYIQLAQIDADRLMAAHPPSSLAPGEPPPPAK